MEQKKKRFTQGLKKCYHCDKSTVLGNFCTECGENLFLTDIKEFARELSFEQERIDRQ